MIVVTADEMRRMDTLAIERFGIPAATLMERAGAGAAAALLARFPHARKSGVVVLAGKGNNGGDGFVVARLLKKRRVRCEVVLAADRATIVDPARAKMLAWQRAGGKTTVIRDGDLGPLARALAKAGLVVDALFGTGIRGEVTGVAAEAITLVNASGLPTVALDIPSGLDADRGVPLGTAIQAEMTVAFAAPKLGTVIYPGARYAGELTVVDIGIPAEAVEEVGPSIFAVDRDDAASLIRPRDPESHKGDNGHVVLIAGGRGKTGAAVLASRAAARAGAGLVTVGCADTIQPVVASALVEQMSAPLPDDGTGHLAFSDPGPYVALLERKNAVVVGPGIGVSDERRAFVEWLLRTSALPIVVDADALNCLAEISPAKLAEATAARILTPHPGEMARLAKLGTAEVQADRVGVARRVARERGAIVILKGARTVIAAPDGTVWINLSGNPGLGSGGTGDVLAGILGGLLAQRYPADEAAVLGVFLHGYAADRLAARRGMIGLLAWDLNEELPLAIAALLAERAETG